MSFKCGGQPFGDVGDQDEAHIIRPFDDLERSEWGERGRLEGRV